MGAEKWADRGYLIVETFEHLWDAFRKPWDGDGYFYGIPKKGVPASGAPKRYRGIDREPLDPYSDKTVETFGDLVAPRREAAAQRTLAVLEDEGRVRMNFIQKLEDAEGVFAAIENPQRFELIWAKDYLGDEDRGDERPAGDARLLGFEPSYLRPDHFSAIADCLFFPRWHGTDREGTAFREYFDSLNEDGLFGTAAEALAYIEYYRSFDWTERATWILTEVWHVH